MNINAEINKIDTKKNHTKYQQKKKLILEKIDKTDRPLGNLIKMWREKNQIIKIRNAKGEITTNTMEIQGIIRDYFENLIPIKLKIFKKWTNTRYL
jgi:hypothetical protein